MYCSSCGIEVADGFRYCPQCGTTTGGSHSVSADRTPARLLQRSRNAKIAGVCAGLATYLGVDVTVVRLLLIVLAIYPPGLGILFYIICWIAMPKEPLLLAPPSSKQTGSVPVTT